ncbi:CocE/NonD family hydrolase [Streptomyces sp. NPDC058417]|uniref:CocE/NonD family hydrolase n=1 Tax=unclassified Streptomyces TaxID=2593676 RepID=UPI0036616BE9
MHAPVELIHMTDVPVPVRDGTVLRADVFRPAGPGPAPVIMTHGPYGKDIHFEDFNAHAYSLVTERGRYMNWETVNPEWWVPRGYAVVRVDQRGTGKSPGRMELQGPGEHQDYYDAIEWAGTQDWSTGRVGLLGISYYAIGQWHVAALRPPHLAAIVPWEGACDLYREWARHGGILSNSFTDAWWPRQITGNQQALDPGDDNPGRAVAGNAELPRELREHPFADAYFQEREVDLSRIEVPVLSCGNWGGYSLHLRGNIEGYLGAGSAHKWLEVHQGNHFTPFYAEESREYQKRFLDRWLKDDTDAWPDDEPPVRLFVRTADGGAFRAEREWPLARTRWQPFHLDARTGSLSPEGDGPRENAETSYPAPDGAVTFLTAPFTEDTEVTGPLALHLWAETDTAEDMDLFVTVINLDPSGREVPCEDASGRPGPVTKGWLRMSHRALDEERSLPHRPFHPHTGAEPVKPGEPFRAAVEIMPTSMVFARGHRLGLVLGAADRAEGLRFLHDDPEDRAASAAPGRNIVHTGPGRESYLLLPVIPADPAGPTGPADPSPAA